MKINKTPQTKKKSTKTKSIALIKAQPKTRKIKNPLEYYECMKNCCLKKQKISQTAHECKHSPLNRNTQITAQKSQDRQKLKTRFRQREIDSAQFINPR